MGDSENSSNSERTESSSGDNISDSDSDESSDKEENEFGVPHSYSSDRRRSTGRAFDELPMSVRLSQQEKTETGLATSYEPSHKKQQKRKRHETTLNEKSMSSSDLGRVGGGAEKGRKDLKRLSKNSPSVMPSNRPVKRFRLNESLRLKNKAVDPRFSDLHGRLNHDKFLHSYEFLGDRQEDEMKSMEKRLKKVLSS